MSIVRIKKVRMIGLAAERDAVLDELQALGCLMPLPLRAADDPKATAPSREVYEALAFLMSCPRRRPQVSDESEFDVANTQKRALELQRTILDLEDERDALVQRLRDLGPWGEFEFPSLEEMNGQHLWFYAVPYRMIPAIESKELPWTLIHQDNANCYIVAISAEEPADMPVPRIRSGKRSPAKVRRRLEEVEQLIEDAQSERSSLTRWCMLFVRHLNLLEDRASLEQVSRQTLDADELFGLEAWAPTERLDEVVACAEQHGLAWEVSDPTPEDDPPTLLRNRPGFDAGEGLVTFYMTPGYWTWDPSSIVLFSFAIFFAMILSDAGYAALLAIGLVYLRKRLSQSTRFMMSLLVGASLIYGVIVGSYFGIAPAEDSILGRLAFLNVNDADTMMALSVIIGVAHVVLANLMNARRLGMRGEALAPLGWTGIILGGFIVAAARSLEFEALETVGVGLMVVGGLLVFLFTGVGQKPVGRAVAGLLAFTKITAALGDVLSYLRLFALGLASASLAVAFNDMAGQMREAMPTLGLLLALLVLLIGHGLNLILSLSSAVIHGLRLNVIEFFNWGLPEEGSPYRVFARKERRPWNH